MYGQATPHCLYNSPAYNEELLKKRERERERERERAEIKDLGLIGHLSVSLAISIHHK